ncbi:up-regulator of cell proliferation-like [Pleurodeles waltl]
MPWHFLNKLLALNITARNTSLTSSPLDHQSQKESKGLDLLNNHDENLSGQCFNPLDVLHALLLCSDSFLQQEILLKMSMCQFALPLVLPPCDGTKCTFLLWAMRDIVRKWRPQSLRDCKGFREESLALIPMPTISFVRLGSLSLSKSKILNEVLSPPQQYHDIFVHWGMKSGNSPRKISDGLVEISWYFPGGKENDELSPEPVAFANLRGDIEFHWLQFSFLTEISSAVFIYIEELSDRQCALLSYLNRATEFYFIVNSQTAHSQITFKSLNKLSTKLKIDQSRILIKDRSINDATFVMKLQSAVERLVKLSQKGKTLEDMAVAARELGIKVDEDCKSCQSAKEYAKQITENIKDVAQYKKGVMKLQGEPWKKLAKTEKELCRLNRQGKTQTEEYKCQLNDELLKIRSEQNKCDLSGGMITFVDGLGQLPQVEKQYFLKWLKFGLDSVARSSLSNLRDKYKEKSKAPSSDPKDLAELDRQISENSLGVEHFVREMGQFYEAECSMVKEKKMKEKDRQFTKLPSIAADLLLEGFPLELIDGDASNIPLTWVTDVLAELEKKHGDQRRMVVITVLGVQSTGKSTLLNTMFGLQFSVSSGRCTRGAFMVLMKVKAKLRKRLGCDFILVIDTEGLKAPELMTLENSYEHDNELATMVIGLSDITIVNMAMENATEMKDILQIVVHSFLRMVGVGKKPNCQFVHQNVSDISAYEQNMRDRKNLLDELDKMTKAAARMEKQDKEITFSDVMEYDPDKHNWYIPGLWHGVPPMAPVNLGYSENVRELKKYLFQFIEGRLQTGAAMRIPQFTEWVKSLWNAVKHENFIFSFRNSLVAEAYNQLSTEYSRWEWAFRKEMHLWVAGKESVIRNQSLIDLNRSTLHNLEKEASEKLLLGEKAMLDSLQTYFESGAENMNLIERYREDFINSTQSLRNELENYVRRKWEETIRIQKGKDKLKDLQQEYLKTIEEKVVRLLDQCRMQHSPLEDEDLEREFEVMWAQTLDELPLSLSEKRNVAEDMYLQLVKDLKSRGSAMNVMIQSAHNLESGGQSFTLKKEHFHERFFIEKIKETFFGGDYWNKTEDIVISLTEACNTFVSDSRGDYDENYCRELLNMINERLQNKTALKLKTSPRFEVDLKLHILWKASQDFQVKDEEYIRENDPRLVLAIVKPQYASTFKDLYLQKDQCQKKAQDFCDRCLKPALEDYINNRLGIEIVDDILTSGQATQYSSRVFFQFTILKDLLQKNVCEDYIEYMMHYQAFVKHWIGTHILDHYKNGKGLEALEKNILSTILKKIRNIVTNSENHCFGTIAGFLENLCHSLQEDLVISKESLQVIIFQNTSNIKEFSGNVLLFLSEVEQSIVSELNACEIQAKFSKLTFSPQDELFKKVFGCGVQCPFCKVPCEAGGKKHKEHFATIHRPQGLGRMRDRDSQKLVSALCSSQVASKREFSNSDTGEIFHPFSGYRAFYPDWNIQPDPSISASDYWKFVYKTFNHILAEKYNAKPSDLPEDWIKLTKVQALESLEEAFNIKE